jgi:hypothetical protein
MLTGVDPLLVLHQFCLGFPGGRPKGFPRPGEVRLLPHRHRPQPLAQRAGGIRVLLGWRSRPVRAGSNRALGATQDESPVEWLLLTTLPIATLEDVRKVVARYCVRWNIEVLYRTLQSGAGSGMPGGGWRGALRTGGVASGLECGLPEGTADGVTETGADGAVGRPTRRHRRSAREPPRGTNHLDRPVTDGRPGVGLEILRPTSQEDRQETWVEQRGAAPGGSRPGRFTPLPNLYFFSPTFSTPT